MLLKIYYKSKYEVVLIFSHRSPAILSCSKGKVIDMLDWYLCPLDSRCTTLSAHNEMVIRCEEDTQVIELDKIA